MKDLIKAHKLKGITYSKYRNLVSQLVEESSTTGNIKAEALIEYTKLNDRRMKRWDKTLKIPNELVIKIKSLGNKMTWLVITESWCGDAAHLLPVFNKIAGLNENIELLIVFRDENEELMNEFLTDGNKSIPKLIIADENNDVLSTYGPRPNLLTKMVKDFKKEHGILTAEFKKGLQVWYNKDKGQTTLEELTNLLCELQPTTCLETEM